MTHLGEQIVRFVRLFAIAFAAQAIGLDFQHLDRSALAAAAIGAAEVAVRQYWRVQKAGGQG